MSVDRLRTTWERLGQDDPLWAVLTHDDYKGGRWDLEEFLATGQHWVRPVLDILGRSSLTLGERVLDFGCGVGRLTFALAEHAREVVGIDVAASMVEFAQKINAMPDRVRFVHYDGRLLPFDDETFDSAVSLIVVQHAPPPVQLACLLELHRVLRPGGVLVVQIPTRMHVPEPLPPDAMCAVITVPRWPAELDAGEAVDVRVHVANAGTGPWPAGQQIKVGNHWLADGAVVILDDGRADLPHDVGPGETCEVELRITAPSRPGRYELEIDMVQESVAWWAQVGSRPVGHPVRVTGRDQEEQARPAPGNGAAPQTAPQDAPRAASQAAPPAAPHAAPHASPQPEVQPEARMEMHGIPAHLVCALFEHCGATVVDVVPDTMAGPHWESMTYVVRRGTA